MNTSIFSIAYEKCDDGWRAMAFVPPIGTIVRYGKTKEEALENFHKAAFAD